MNDRGATRTPTEMYCGAAPFTTNPIRLKSGIYLYLHLEKSVTNSLLVTFLCKWKIMNKSVVLTYRFERLSFHEIFISASCDKKQKNQYFLRNNLHFTLFLNYLTTLSASRNKPLQMNWEGLRSKWSWHTLKVILRNVFGRTEKNHEILNISCCPAYSTWTLPKHKKGS